MLDYANDDKDLPDRVPWLRAPDWLLGVLFWFLASLPELSHELFRHEPGTHSGGPAGYWVYERILPLYLWIPLSPIVFRLADRWPLHRSVAPNLLRHIGAAGVLLLIHSAALVVVQYFFGYQHVRDAEWSHRAVHLSYPLGKSALMYGPLLLLGSALAYYRRFAVRSRQASALLLQRSQLQSRLAEARLEALSGQLHPHFLFNALNSVSALVKKDPAGAREVLAKLSELLRSSLAATDLRTVPLRKELKVVGLYLAIQEIRFRDRLKVSLQVAGETKDAHVPPFLLQPLVENAIRYGSEGSDETCDVMIETERRAEKLLLRIANSLQASAEGKAREGLGIGLRNTEERLQVIYGDDYELEIDLAPLAATVLIEIPFHREALAERPWESGQSL